MKRPHNPIFLLLMVAESVVVIFLEYRDLQIVHAHIE